MDLLMLNTRKNICLIKRSRYTILHWATRFKKTELIRILIAAGADVNAGCYNSREATLYEGAVNGMTKNTVALLIDAGALYRTANA